MTSPENLDEVLNGGKPLDVKRVQKKGTNWKILIFSNRSSY